MILGYIFLFLHESFEPQREKKKNQSAAGTGGLGIRIEFYCQQIFISVSSKLSVSYYYHSSG